MAEQIDYKDFIIYIDVENKSTVVSLGEKGHFKNRNLYFRSRNIYFNRKSKDKILFICYDMIREYNTYKYKKEQDLKTASDIELEVKTDLLRLNPDAL